MSDQIKKFVKRRVRSMRLSEMELARLLRFVSEKQLLIILRGKVAISFHFKNFICELGSKIKKQTGGMRLSDELLEKVYESSQKRRADDVMSDLFNEIRYIVSMHKKIPVWEIGKDTEVFFTVAMCLDICNRLLLDDIEMGKMTIIDMVKQVYKKCPK